MNNMFYGLYWAFYNNPAEVTVTLFVTAIMMTIAFFACLIEWILKTLARWKMYEKAGEPSWKALIPFYNNYTEVKFAWNKEWALVYLISLVACILFSCLASTGSTVISVLACLISIFLVVIHIIYCVKLSKAFGHKGGWAVGLIFVDTIFYLMIGLGKSQYSKPAEPAEPVAEEAPKA